MTVRMHRSTDLGAVALTGQQGKMNALLLEVLCKGVPAASPTSITRTGSTATCSYAGHKFITGQTVTVYGAAQSEYNGNQVITVIDADTFTFPVSSGAVTPATGSITVGGQRTIGTPSSITRSGTTVTVALAAHGLPVGGRAFLMGADQADYNGWQTAATVPDANTFTFELASTQTPTTPATGTILVRYGEAGLGWSMPYTSTNRSVFKQGVQGTRNQSVLVVDETNATHHTYGAAMFMAEGATAVSTLTGSFYSTEAITYTGMFKSGTADAVARKWVVVGDHRTCIILTQPAIPSSNDTAGWVHSYFGDFVSYLPNDNYPTLCFPMARCSSYAFNQLSSYVNNLSGAFCSVGYADYAAACPTGTADGQIAPVTTRTHLGATGIVAMQMVACGNAINSNSATISRATYRLGDRHPTYSADTYPDPVHGGINLEKLYLVHRTAVGSGDPVTRGEMRGIWNPMHRRSQMASWANNDTFAGSGELAGKTFEAFFSATATTCWFVVETSDTWSL